MCVCVCVCVCVKLSYLKEKKTLMGNINKVSEAILGKAESPLPKSNAEGPPWSALERHGSGLSTTVCEKIDAHTHKWVRRLLQGHTIITQSPSAKKCYPLTLKYM